MHDAVREGNTALAAGDDDGRAARRSAERTGDARRARPRPARSGVDAGAGGASLEPVVDALVALALEQRAAARERKDWAAADAVRDQLKQAGVVVEDTPHGPRWTVGEQRLMPGNSQRRGRRTTSKKGAAERLRRQEPASPCKGRGRPCPPTSGRGTRATRAPRSCPQRPPGSRTRSAGPRPPRGARPRSASRAPRTPPGAGAAAGRPAGGPQRAAGRRRAAARGSRPGAGPTPPKDAPELLVGRNPVVEALRAHVPATALYVAQGIDVDDRITEIVRTAGDRGIPILEVSRAELDRMTGGVLHQGIGLQVPPFAYEPFDDLLAAALEQPAPLLVALDGVTDPRNLGAVIRSAAAFGAHGVFVPERRAAGITATAWRTSAGAAARVPVAQVTNLTRALKACQQDGLHRGRAGRRRRDRPVRPGGGGRAAASWWSAPRGAACPGWSARPATCGSASRWRPTVESLNARVAAAVTLAEVARRRRCVTCPTDRGYDRAGAGPRRDPSTTETSMAEHDGFALGVDLGTSHTVAILRWPDGRTRPLLFDGRRCCRRRSTSTTPAGCTSAGTRSAWRRPTRPGSSPTRSARIDEPAVLLGDREVPVVDLLAALLGAVAREAVEAVGFLPPAVLTFPAAWGRTP